MLQLGFPMGVFVIPIDVLSITLNAETLVSTVTQSCPCRLMEEFDAWNNTGRKFSFSILIIVLVITGDNINKL